MPILQKQSEIYPENLFEAVREDLPEGHCWWAMYTRSRQEKELMRRLLSASVPFYSPLIAKRTRSPLGRVRTSYIPLFSNYVFVFGDLDSRAKSISTNCISQCIEVSDSSQLTQDLYQIHRLIQTDAPLTPESRLMPGQPVRVKSGRFRGFEGVIVRREGEVRLLVAVNFLQQGASMVLDDFEVEAI